MQQLAGELLTRAPELGRGMTEHLSVGLGLARPLALAMGTADSAQNVGHGTWTMSS